MTQTSAPIEIAARMAEAASAWLDALAPEQRAKATFDFDDVAERTSWAYFPRNHQGLPLLEMDPAQQKRAHALIALSLSRHAYGKVTTIMGLESVLNNIEGRRADAVRDPGRYFVSVFGAPGSARWGWRLEGHHVCLNVTIADAGLVSPVPIFLGANPAEVRHGDTPVIRPCGEEEDVARELIASLDADQRREAVLCDRAPPDFVLTNAPLVPDTCLPGELAPPLLARLFDSMREEDRETLRLDIATPRGLPASRMHATQRDLLRRLIDVYVDRLPEAIAAIERARIDEDAVHFAWAGEERPRRGHYYRLHGPSFLVEYDNTQDGANHVHAVWRSPERDFARDLLRLHLKAAH
jgi:hypothetical protein